MRPVRERSTPVQIEYASTKPLVVWFTKSVFKLKTDHICEPFKLNWGDFAMHARAYLRASTNGQDATRARGVIEAFAADHNLTIVGTFVENESGAKLHRPELFRLLADCRPGNVLLVEQVDRLSRLTEADWLKLRTAIEAKQVRVVALDLPTSWQLTVPGDEFTRRTFSAINAMMLDMLAAVARKDYEDRRRRQAQGIAKAKAGGAYRGRPEDTHRNAGIAGMLRSGMSWSAIQAAAGCSRATVAKIAKRALASAELREARTGGAAQSERLSTKGP
jgi:DNA invertase Pin-like site-specific DNA recombinase